MSKSSYPSVKEQQILETAQSLFASHGYHAVGVDNIKDTAGVAKMTLYKHFPSKEVLIEKVLGRRDEGFRASLTAAVEKASEPMARLQAVFAWHRQWFEQPDFNGCMFIKAVEEFPLAYAAIRNLSRDHKRWVQELLMRLVQSVGVQNPDAIALHLLVVLDGLIVHANLFRQPSVVDETWRHVEQMIVLAGGATGAKKASTREAGKHSRRD